MAVPLQVISIATFIWKEVVPVVKQIIKIVGADTYVFIKEKVLEVEVTGVSGISKRLIVFGAASKYLQDKGFKDIDVFGMGVLYFLIELAVMNMKRANKEKKTKKVKSNKK